MTDVTVTTETTKPKRKYVRRGGRPKKQAAPAEPVREKASPFAGITATKCCDACKPDRCVISTVAACKHPMNSGDGGCGPITIANRAEALKLIKIEQIKSA